MRTGVSANGLRDCSDYPSSLRGPLRPQLALADAGACRESFACGRGAARHPIFGRSALEIVTLAVWTFWRKGRGEREDELHGFLARLTIRPDIERVLDGRAAGSGALVSGTLDSVSFKSSDDDNVKRETETLSLSLERREVRRRMSFPAATLSLVGDFA